MRKIPTLFVRNPDDRAHVLSEVTPECEWVLAGEGEATRKYDGTCVLVRDGLLYGRREIKAGKPLPPDFEQVEHDETTGKIVGWVPVTDDPEWRWHREAGDRLPVKVSGTYELVGPKINGNPEGYQDHVLVSHEWAARLTASPRDFEGLRSWLLESDFEGIVWHHPDGRMAKLKKRDFAARTGRVQS